MAKQQVEGQRHRKERQPDGHGLFPARWTLCQGRAEPAVDAADPVLVGLLEQAVAAGQPGAARGRKLPGMQGFLVGEAEDDLELVVVGRRGQYAGTQVAGCISW
ncbi:hypothetical protein D3C77_570690 [compost metagenome]